MADTKTIKTIVVTGGAGFIGSALVRMLLKTTQHRVIVVDKLTYAGHLASLSEVETHPNYHFVKHDINDQAALRELFASWQPDALVHLAAETHVDRSIDGPAAFLQTNVMGTVALLELSRHYYQSLTGRRKADFRFLHVSTDEVFGALGETGFFSEDSAYQPRSPYAASKAASDHFVRAWYHTYGLPVLVSNCANNYGPYQFPEKLIPRAISRALAGEAIPVYGQGQQVRDWLFVDDHVRALLIILEKGVVGETYAIGSSSERRTLEVAESICDLLSELAPQSGPYRELISFVSDRPGHDWRYAVDDSKLRSQLGWQPQESFESGLKKTVAWYLANQAWTEQVLSGSYQLERLGLAQT